MTKLIIVSVVLFFMVSLTPMSDHKKSPLLIHHVKEKKHNHVEKIHTHKHATERDLLIKKQQEEEKIDCCCTQEFLKSSLQTVGELGTMATSLAVVIVDLVLKFHK